ncbi:MAG: barstar family protein [Candidatus Paceibacterota bacterium]
MFEEDFSKIRQDEDFAVEIPHGISDKNQLFAFYAKALLFPEYFGGNWDALDECLRDLSWISQKRIALFHRDIPCIGNPLEQATYLDVLVKCSEDWKSDPKHELRIVFDPRYADQVKALCKQEW